MVAEPDFRDRERAILELYKERHKGRIFENEEKDLLDKYQPRGSVAEPDSHFRTSHDKKSSEISTRSERIEAP